MNPYIEKLKASLQGIPQDREDGAVFWSCFVITTRRNML